jgi:flagellar basal body-associated protein FliL
MPKKAIIGLVLVLVLGGGFFMMKKMSAPKGPAHKAKVEGVLLTMDPEFLLNLSDGHMAKFTVTLLLAHDDPAAEAMAAAGGGHEAAPAAPAPHPQNALLRSIVTDEVTEASSEQLLSAPSRRKLLRSIKREFSRSTDAHVSRVLISDLVVD